MVQVVLPNDANPLGFILGGTVMHLIDIAGAIASHRHTRTLLVTAAVDGLQFLHPIKVGDLIILRARVTAAWSTSLEVEVEVFSEETLTGVRRLTSRAYLTFVAVDREGQRMTIPGLILDTDGGPPACGGGRRATGGAPDSTRGAQEAPLAGSVQVVKRRLGPPHMVRFLIPPPSCDDGAETAAAIAPVGNTAESDKRPSILRLFAIVGQKAWQKQDRNPGRSLAIQGSPSAGGTSWRQTAPCAPGDVTSPHVARHFCRMPATLSWIEPLGEHRVGSSPAADGAFIVGKVSSKAWQA